MPETESVQREVGPLAPSTRAKPNGPVPEAVMQQGRQIAAVVGRTTRTAGEFSATRIRSHPLTSAAVALGAGAVIGAAISSMAASMRWRRTAARARREQA
jgi:hypothetical protein